MSLSDGDDDEALIFTLRTSHTRQWPGQRSEGHPRRRRGQGTTTSPVVGSCTLYWRKFEPPTYTTNASTNQIMLPCIMQVSRTIGIGGFCSRPRAVPRQAGPFCLLSDGSGVRGHIPTATPGRRDIQRYGNRASEAHMGGLLRGAPERGEHKRKIKILTVSCP